MSMTAGLQITVNSVKHLPRCQRCWNYREDVTVHMYWPAYSICARCVGVLLEIKWPPFILRPGTADDYYVCKDEAEWWAIHFGQKTLPEAA